MSARATQRTLMAAAVALGGLFWGGWDGTGGVRLTASAEARVGRPATPVSYAGVARRTTRRAVTTGVAIGVAASAPAPVYVVPAPGCVQVVDAYGRIAVVCP